MGDGGGRDEDAAIEVGEEELGAELGTVGGTGDAKMGGGGGGGGATRDVRRAQGGRWRSEFRARGKGETAARATIKMSLLGGGARLVHYRNSELVNRFFPKFKIHVQGRESVY